MFLQITGEQKFGDIGCNGVRVVNHVENLESKDAIEAVRFHSHPTTIAQKTAMKFGFAITQRDVLTLHTMRLVCCSAIFFAEQLQ